MHYYTFIYTPVHKPRGLFLHRACMVPISTNLASNFMTCGLNLLVLYFITTQVSPFTIHSFIHLFNKCLWCTYYVQGPMPGAQRHDCGKAVKAFVLLELNSLPKNRLNNCTTIQHQLQAVIGAMKEEYKPPWVCVTGGHSVILESYCPIWYPCVAIEISIYIN